MNRHTGALTGGVKPRKRRAVGIHDDVPVHIGSDAAHLYHMLLDKELIEKNEFTERAAKKHAEIMKFRFDHERSNLEDMPEWVRKPLFNILGQYADGAVERADNKWIDIELNDDFLNKTKYKFHER